MIASSSPLVRRMAEDYRVTAADGGARLEWTLAAVPTGVGQVAARTFLRPVLGGIWRGAVRGLKKRVRSRS